ncbi:MAG: VOC family protein [Bacilli bacterium]|nr:VOC family protein [Bacilli bacterium]
MILGLAHIGLTVNNLKESINFYQNILGLKLIGKIVMKGKETDILFNGKNIVSNIAYFESGENIKTPPLELISFENNQTIKSENSLFKSSISEVCFYVKDIDKWYDKLIKNNVIVLSKPQYFDFSEYGFSKSKAMYFKDNNGIILEMMETL